MRWFAADRIEIIVQLAKRRQNLFHQPTKVFAFDQFSVHVDLERFPIENAEAKTNHSTDVSLLIKDANEIHERTNEEQTFSFVFFLLRRKKCWRCRLCHCLGEQFSRTVPSRWQTFAIYASKSRRQPFLRSSGVAQRVSTIRTRKVRSANFASVSLPASHL